jgi:UDP-N-acetyl-D-mannosaminuronic acid transferase (WecB/TagA/CpsF family)
MQHNILLFHGIKFHNYSYSKILFKLNQVRGGYLVAPAASSLSKIYKDKFHYEALKKSTVAIFDSGMFCILLFIFKRLCVKKFSGYLFLNKLLNDHSIKNKKILTVDPSILDSKKNRLHLFLKNFKRTKSYVAPIYKRDESNFVDKKIIKLINEFKPRYILINIGGEIQERLALYISKNIKFKVNIFCLGAAIGFYTGTQAPINSFVDKYYMGWLLRVIYNPRLFLIRVLKSTSLILLFFK